MGDGRAVRGGQHQPAAGLEVEQGRRGQRGPLAGGPATGEDRPDLARQLLSTLVALEVGPDLGAALDGDAQRGGEGQDVDDDQDVDVGGDCPGSGRPPDDVHPARHTSTLTTGSLAAFHRWRQSVVSAAASQASSSSAVSRVTARRRPSSSATRT